MVPQRSVDTLYCNWPLDANCEFLGSYKLLGIRPATCDGPSSCGDWRPTATIVSTNGPSPPPSLLPGHLLHSPFGSVLPGAPPRLQPTTRPAHALTSRHAAPQNKKEADPGVDRPNMNEMGRSKLEQDEEGGTPGELWVGLGVGVPFFTISIVLLVRNLYLNDRLRQYHQAVRVAAPGADCDDDGTAALASGSAQRV